jgi:ParB family chromosome partitioning protein
MSMKKRGLGRGLDALLGGSTPEVTATPAPPSAGTSPPAVLPIERLRANRRQPRTHFDEESLAELAASIRTQGLVQPIVVTPAADGTFTIVAGERRFRAAQQAGLTEVPVAVREVADERALLELALVENLQREDLDPIEEGEAYRVLQESFGLSQEAIAERVGKSRPAVANALRLLRLPPAVRELLATRRLSAGQARPLLALEEEARQVALAQRAVEEGLTARDLEALVRPEPAKAPARKSPPPADVHHQAAAERLTRRLQTRVEIDQRGRGGLVRIHFHSEEELMRLFDLLIGGDDAPAQ